MPEPDLTRIKWMRAKAEELRTVAESMQAAGARVTMLGLADSYDVMADHLEKAPAAREGTG